MYEFQRRGSVPNLRITEPTEAPRHIQVSAPSRAVSNPDAAFDSTAPIIGVKAHPLRVKIDSRLRIFFIRLTRVAIGTLWVKWGKDEGTLRTHPSKHHSVGDHLPLFLLKWVHLFVP
jgi:hypothetical protein